MKLDQQIPKSAGLLVLVVVLSAFFYLQPGSESGLLWRDMTTPQRVESLERRLAAAISSGKRQMRGDLKTAIEDMIDLAEKNPDPKFCPVLLRAAETAAEYRYPATASRAYEHLGLLPKAAEMSRQAGHGPRTRELQARIAEGGTEAGRETVQKLRLGLEWLNKAEEAYKTEGKSASAQGKEPVRTKEFLGKAQTQLRDTPLPIEDFKRLLTLQLMLAATRSEVETVAKEANWLPPSQRNAGQALDQQVRLWTDLAAESGPELADIYLSKALAQLRDGKPDGLPADLRQRVLEIRTEVAYANARFAEALVLARELFPNDKSKLHLYEFADSASADSMRQSPYRFPAAEKTQNEVTYISLFSPRSGRYVHQGYEQMVAPPKNTLVWPETSAREGLKVRFRSDDDFLYFLSLTGGFRHGFKPGFYGTVKQEGVSPASPGIGFTGAGHFKYGQFLVHEVEWDEKGQVVRVAVDFLGSASGKLSDVCYGKVRYRSRYK